MTRHMFWLSRAVVYDRPINPIDPYRALQISPWEESPFKNYLSIVLSSS